MVTKRRELTALFFATDCRTVFGLCIKLRPLTMTTAVTSLSSTQPAHGLVRRAWRFSLLLTLAGLTSLALIPLFILAALLDPRTITGVPAWIKPLKFAISAAIFSATFIWLLTFVDRTPNRSSRFPNH